MSNYPKLYNPNKTSQSESIPNRKQVKNNAGGYTFKLGCFARLKRFLILGSDAPTYYQNTKELTVENASAVMECWSEDALLTMHTIKDISDNNRAPKHSPLIFALALGTTHEEQKVRRVVYDNGYRILRTASHLFEFLHMCQALGRGYGRGMKRLIANWYGTKSTDKLAYQMIKYRMRNGFTHKRAIELCHKGAGDDPYRIELYRWVKGKEFRSVNLPVLIKVHLMAMRDTPIDQLTQLIKRYKLPWEAIPTEALRTPEIWQAMIPHMGLTALIRNLGNMTACGALHKFNYPELTTRLVSHSELKKARIHPFNILQALTVYKSGCGVKGDKTWQPLTYVINALDHAFYKSFDFVEPTGKNILLALDVSGSMTSSIMGSPLSCREASVALALITMATEKNTHVVGFTSENQLRWGSDTALTSLNISPRQRLDDAVENISKLPFGATDCALPMTYALENKLDVDAFIVYTDNETYAGSIHPCQALTEYRKKMRKPSAKLIVVGMTSTGFSIADPQDRGMLDIVGFDSACPTLISDFIKSE